MNKDAKKADVDLKDIKAARTWFRDMAMSISQVNAPKMLQTSGPFTSFQNLTINSIGKMYCFFYDAKHKKTLPYWDKFPLIFPIEFYNDGFLGINLHYLPPVTRAKLMDALYRTASNKKFDSSTVLQISYSILKGSARYKAFRPCVKRYLATHVVSKFVFINPKDWDKCLLLPSERFQKKSKQFVWGESLEMI